MNEVVSPWKRHTDPQLHGERYSLCNGVRFSPVTCTSRAGYYCLLMQPLSAHHVLWLLWLVRFWLLILHPLTPSPRLPFLASIRGDLGQQPTAMYIRRDGCRWAPAYLPSKSLPADLEGWLTSNRGTRSIHPRNLPGPYPSFNSALLNHHHPRHCPLPVSLCPLVSSIWSQTP